MKKILLCLVLILAACSFKKNQLENQTLKGHEELYSGPDAPKLEKLSENHRRVVIASTNDVQGNYRTKEISFKDDHVKAKQIIKIGGVDTMASYFKILRDTYSQVVLVDSGDIFSNSGQQKTVQDFYSLLGYDAVTVGLNDFNLKLPSSVASSTEFIKNFAKKSEVPLVLSNLFDLKTGRVIEWEGTKPYSLKDLGGVKIGIIGLIPDDIVTNTPVQNRVGFFVENMLQSTLRNARLLRSLGADIIVVLTHQGLDCTSTLAQETKLPPMKVNFEPHRANACKHEGVLGTFLDRLPPHLVDVVIGGRTHSKMANYVNGILVMGGFEQGKSFNFAELIVDTKTDKIVPELTVVHQPVFFCHEFFKETQDCFYEDPSVNHEKRMPATFLGKPIIKEMADEKSKSIQEEHLEVRNFKLEVNKTLGHFNADLIYLPATTKDSQLIVLNVKGSTLLKILEEDFNNSRQSIWHPSPFLQKGDFLHLSISGLDLDPGKEYRIVSDLEAIQSQNIFVKSLNTTGSHSFLNLSWNSLNDEIDSIQTQLAAPLR